MTTVFIEYEIDNSLTIENRLIYG